MRFVARLLAPFAAIRLRWPARMLKTLTSLQGRPPDPEPLSPAALLLRDVPIPQPFDIAEYCAAISKRRQRRIRLCAKAMNGKPFGLWVPLETEDQIWYERDTSAWHQQHIILHELGHMLRKLGLSNRVPPDAYPLELLPDLDPERFVGMRRDGYATPEEDAAESFARDVRRRIEQRSATSQLGANTRATGFLKRLSNLHDGGDDGWSAS